MKYTWYILWQHWDYGEETKWFLRKTCRLADYCERQAPRVDLLVSKNNRAIYIGIPTKYINKNNIRL